ncbi:Transcription initiation factor TFIID subunit 1 [Nakaseomyces bracarensis]|uniref:Transcription initiation factor TFIID subunit 1 n=1 Tax=Nakaseomyces bracarensis TaxID=273131 RepID=A0ABR4NWU5_9SACH
MAKKSSGKSKGSKSKGGSGHQSQGNSHNKDLSNEDEAYNAIFEGNFGSLEIGGYIGNDDGATEHLPDAVDFEDEDELADEELPDEEDGPAADFGTGVSMNEDVMMQGYESAGAAEQDLFDIQQQPNDHFMSGIPNDNSSMMGSDASNDEFHSGQNALFMGMEHTHDSLYMDNNPVFPTEQANPDDEIKKNAQLELRAQLERKMLKKYFPTFTKGKILKWNKLIYRKRADYDWGYKSFSGRGSLKPLFPLNLKIHVQPDQRRLFELPENKWQATSKNKSKDNKRKGVVQVKFDERNSDSTKDNNLNDTDNGVSEDLIIATDDWNEDQIINGKEEKEQSKEFKFITNLFDSHESWNWNEDDLVNGKLKQAVVAELNMNDQNLLLIDETNKKKKEIEKVDSNYQLDIHSILKKFNISNDEKYAILKRAHQTKIRAIISNLNIEHSKPAARLQSPFYKVTMPRSQLRHFHRANFGASIRPGTNIVFSKLKIRKRKRDKGKDIKESFATTQDLTIGDTAPIYLMEYSEEHPLALSKFGMGNKLINYYRKLSEEDTLRPKLPVGETHVLGVQDKSPFWSFGLVEPGHIVPTLYNNMLRAPVFKHEVSGTDFLLIRSTGNGISNRFYLRNINHLFTVGQTFPVDEIPGPNSRRVTSMKATRLRMIVYRLLNKAATRSISIDPIAEHFPESEYGQNRQKIKEFMKYQREGPDKGLWRLKEGEPLLDGDNIKKLLTPEQVSEVEVMGHGIQNQEDNELYNYDEDLVKLEENLTPWNASKNFINATQLRAMIQIHGSGDPTGCGEGFSFLKTSMKGGFLKSTTSLTSLNNATKKNGSSSGYSYNVAQQQKVYEDEITRTWYTHTKSLSISNPFEEISDPDEVNESNRNVNPMRRDGKYLRIVRKTRDENGIIQRQTVIIRDPRIIQGYLKRKEIQRKDNLNVDKLLEESTDIHNIEDIEMQKKILETELANLEKSQQRRARQVSKKTTGKVTKGPKNTSRRCATCGQVGHIRTNKSCPMYYSPSGPGGGQERSSSVAPPE